MDHSALWTITIIVVVGFIAIMVYELGYRAPRENKPR